MNAYSSTSGIHRQGSTPLNTSASDALPSQLMNSSSSRRKSRFAGVAANYNRNSKRQPKKKSDSIKFSANNFVTECYESFEDHYTIVELLGEGAYGEVFVCGHKESGAERAVKILEVSTEEEAEKVLSEFNILRGMDHPNLLKIYNLYIQEHEAKDKSIFTFYIVSDLYEGGELFTELEEYGHFVEEDVALIMMSTLSCLNYCHAQNIFHRDIKPENILLADDQMNLSDIKIIDLGLAEYFEEYSDRFTERVGSSYYIAPEVLAGDYGPKCDIWSCGVVAFILLCGEAPFDGDDENGILDSVRAGAFDMDNPHWDNVSNEAKDFVEMLLTYEEDDRPTAEMALQHPWLETTRKNSRLGLQESDSQEAVNVLTNLETFCASSKLKQAVCAFTASQLIRKQEKDVIDGLFRAMDTKCDGKLCKEELKVGYEDYMDRALTEEEVNDIFQRVNYSCSGAIEYSEFVVASIKLDESRLRATFNEFHKRGCDALDADDLKRVLDLGEDDENKDEYVLKIMNQIDTNHDLLISFEEFKAAMMGGESSSNACPSSDTVDIVASRTSRRRPSTTPSNLKRLLTLHLDGCNIYKPSDLRKCQSLGMDELLSSLQSTINKQQQKMVNSAKSFTPHATSVGYARRPDRKSQLWTNKKKIISSFIATQSDSSSSKNI